MKTLFIHGMGVNPTYVREWQLECLQQVGLVPFSLHIDYNRTPNKFTILKDYILENGIEFLVGRSHGGFLGFWLGEELGIPCLLINPQLSIRIKKQMKPPITQTKCPLCLVALGTDDYLVDADRTLMYLEQEDEGNPNKIVKTKLLEGVGHWLDEDLFTTVLWWGLGEVQKIKKLQIMH